MCSCFVNKGLVKKEIHFEDVANCSAVKDSLKELVYGVCVLFAIGFVISFSTALCSSCLLHKERKRRRMVSATLHMGNLLFISKDTLVKLVF